jgi:hypothetical protein
MDSEKDATENLGSSRCSSSAFLSDMLIFGTAWAIGSVCGKLVLWPFDASNWAIAFGCTLGAIGQIVVARIVRG